MGLLDDIKDKAEDAAKNVDHDKVKEFAEQHNISVEEAKDKLFNKGDDK